jgi:uncharacterized protein involved in exopolysaccharide biosynthesis
MTPSQSLTDSEPSLLGYARILWKRRRLIVWLCTASVLTAMIVSLLMPKIYESSATLLPEISAKEGGGLGSLLAGSVGGQGMGITLPGIPVTPTDIFVAMLKSRIMADEVIRHFDLMRLWRKKGMQDTRNALQDATKITVSKEKVIKIAVEARSPSLAADIANFYVTNLDRLNRTMNVSKASHNRAFIEARLADTQVSLIKAEEALKQFQTSNKTVAVEAQSKAMIEAAALIQGQISAQEVQLKVMSGYLSPDNPELTRLRSAIDELRKQLYVLESGTSGKGMLPGDRFYPAMITVPSLALDHGRLLRDLKVQETLYTLLTSQYEQAKLSEARDTPTVQVLDPAIPAETKIKPSVTRNMTSAGVVAVFVAIFLAFVLEYFERMRSEPQTTIVQGSVIGEIMGLVKGQLPSLTEGARKKMPGGGGSDQGPRPG